LSGTNGQGRTQGGLGLKTLELDILQKLYYLRKGDYRKTSISPPWLSIFQPFLYRGVLLEVAFN